MKDFYNSTSGMHIFHSNSLHFEILSNKAKQESRKSRYICCVLLYLCTYGFTSHGIHIT